MLRHVVDGLEPEKEEVTRTTLSYVFGKKDVKKETTEALP